VTGAAPLELDVPEAGAAQHRALTAGQLAALLSADHLVELRPAPSGLWKITGRRRVGVVRVGAGADAVVLNLLPKLPVSNVLFLLSYATKPDMWRQEVVTTEVERGLAPALADAYARIVHHALADGVLHGYRETADNLPTLRGRIDVPAQIRACGLPLPVAVRFDDFTPDTAENRIVAGALNRLMPLPALAPATRSALRHLTARLDGVTALKPGAPLPAWTPNRLNTRYLHALRMAELILAEQSPDLRSGSGAQLPGIAIDLETVFEAFLAAALNQAARTRGLRCTAQDTHHRLDAARRIAIRPDVTLYRDAQPSTVLDAKYKASDRKPGHREDLYQITSYCTALGLPTGHLVYAHGPATPLTHRIGPHGTAITIHGIDLTRPPAQILAATDDIMQHAVVQISRTPATRVQT